MAKKPKTNRFSITNEKFYNFIKLTIAILLGLALAFVVLCFVSKDPVNAFVTILTGPLKKPRYMGVVIEKFVPFLFSGLCCCLLFKCGFFNLGGEGIFIASGLLMSVFACNEQLAIAGVHPAICILVAAVSGGLLMLIPAFFKAKYGANELVLSLMLNSAYLGLGTYIIKYHFLTTTTSLIASPDYQPTARIGFLSGQFFQDYHISITFFLGILATFLVWFVLYRTKLGYQIRLVGTNPKFADYAGINSFSLAMKTNFIAGALCGIGSAIQLLTQFNYFNWTGVNSPGIGFSGALMAMIGQSNPIGTFFASFFIKYLEQGTTVLYYSDTSVPSEIVAIIEGVIVLLVSSTYFLRRLREKKLLKEGLQSEYRNDREAK